MLLYSGKLYVAHSSIAYLLASLCMDAVDRYSSSVAHEAWRAQSEIQVFF